MVFLNVYQNAIGVLVKKKNSPVMRWVEDLALSLLWLGSLLWFGFDP